MISHLLAIDPIFQQDIRMHHFCFLQKKSHTPAFNITSLSLPFVCIALYPVECHGREIEKVEEPKFFWYVLKKPQHGLKFSKAFI